MKKSLKLRYTPQQFEKINKKAKEMGLSLEDYQRKISKTAKVEIKIEE